MTLFEKLAAATSEEDVKAAYIKALGLKDVQRNLIDIQTKEVWFEAKLGGKHSTYAMFTQFIGTHFVSFRIETQEREFVDTVKRAIASGMGRYGRASNELFVQFITRIAAEIPNATLAMFSKMKYINAQALEVIRRHQSSLVHYAPCLQRPANTVRNLRAVMGPANTHHPRRQPSLRSKSL